jgi:hypothetical protein
MMGRPKTRWIFLLSLILVLTTFYVVRGRDAQSASNWVGTQTCIDCHNTWLDNNPPTGQVILGEVSTDYPPLTLHSTGDPWYTIPEGWTTSIHNVPAFNITKTDEVPCEACHGSGQAHFGSGTIPVPIPGTKVCIGCHTPAHGFDTKAFLKTSHANPNNNPRKFFDQPSYGVTQAKITAKSPVSNAPVGTLLFMQGTFGPTGDPVSRNARIEECSTCHQYAMQYPQFSSKIAQGNLPPKPEVSCGACHDAHIVAPDALQPAIVTTTVVVNQISGSSTVVSVSAVPGRKMSYINNKPYPVAETGAMDTNKGIWTRGSAINRPQTVLMKGSCAVATGSDGTCSLVTLTCGPCEGIGGFLDNQVKEGDTLVISGVSSSVTVPLPADAKLRGTITVGATLDGGTYEVIQVIDNKTVLVGAPIVASTSVTYIKTDGKTTATLTVDVPFCGLPALFEVRDTLTNTEDLCMSCHTKGQYKFTKWGKESNGTLVNLSPTHNINVGGQYKSSGHADRFAPAWEEFFTYGGHNLNWPYDMSITGSGGVGSLRNKGKTAFVLTTSDQTLAYLSQKGNTNVASTTGSFNCLQCHNGLSTIDYMNDVQGTSAASVVWGDATLVCISCHDPHADQISANGKGPNLRKPVKLSYNSRFVTTTNPRGGLNTMMDRTAIPSGVEEGNLCLFCHQGRESGYTVYLNITSNGVDPYKNPDQVIKGGSGISFQNPHYLESGALIWSKNSYEYLTVSGNPTPNKYSNGISSHQETNCGGCHMPEASENDFEGGHTWRPRIEVCQKCHPTAKTFRDIKAGGDYNGNGVVESAYAEIGTINPDTGLLGQLRAALQAQGIYYNPDQNPYFFTGPDSKTTYTAWTTNTLTAAFNLQFMNKSGSCTPVHNVFYAAQILQDSIKAAKGKTMPWVRPAGDRPATNYAAFPPLP